MNETNENVKPSTFDEKSLTKNDELMKISMRQKEIDEKINEKYLQIQKLEYEIDDLKDDFRDIEREKCRVIGHFWVQDHSYASGLDDLVCERCLKLS